MILGKKIGMTQIFEDEKLIPVTVIEAGTNFITQIKTEEKEEVKKTVQTEFKDKKKEQLQFEQPKYNGDLEAPKIEKTQEEKIMDNFQVYRGANEPTAYFLCAGRELNKFPKKENEKLLNEMENQNPNN